MLVCLAVVLIAISAVTCVRIEYLNARVGGYLPRPEGQGKWRVAGRRATTEGALRRLRFERMGLYEKQHGRRPPAQLERELLDAPLTERERAVIRREVVLEERMAQLHEWVETMGVAQYIIAPAALMLSAYLAVMSKSMLGRAVTFFGACISLVAVILMLYRQYFTSLGW